MAPRADHRRRAARRRSTSRSCAPTRAGRLRRRLRQAAATRRRAAPGESLAETSPAAVAGDAPCAWPRARVDRGRVSALSSVATLVVQSPPPAPHASSRRARRGVRRAELDGDRCPARRRRRRAPRRSPSPTPSPSPGASPSPRGRAPRRGHRRPQRALRRAPARRRARPRAAGLAAALALAVAVAHAQAAAARVPRLPPQRSRGQLRRAAPVRAAHDERVRGHARSRWASAGATSWGRWSPRSRWWRARARTRPAWPCATSSPPATPDRRGRPRRRRTASRSRGARPRTPTSRPIACTAQAPGGPRERVGEVAPPETSLRDTTAAPGARYVYTVTAVDRAGNESPPSAPAPGGRP